MKKPALESISIQPSANGGHIVRHSYKAKPTMKGGTGRGGLSMDYAPPEEHVFGPKDKQKLLAHITSQLGIGGGSESPNTGED